MAIYIIFLSTLNSALILFFRLGSLLQYRVQYCTVAGRLSPKLKMWSLKWSTPPREEEVDATVAL